MARRPPPNWSTEVLAQAASATAAAAMDSAVRARRKPRVSIPSSSSDIPAMAAPHATANYVSPIFNRRFCRAKVKAMKKKENSPPMTRTRASVYSVRHGQGTKRPHAAGRPRRYSPFGAAIEAPKAAGGLYLVATPIGNLGRHQPARARAAGGAPTSSPARTPASPASSPSATASRRR